MPRNARNPRPPPHECFDSDRARYLAHHERARLRHPLPRRAGDARWHRPDRRTPRLGAHRRSSPPTPSAARSARSPTACSSTQRRRAGAAADRAAPTASTPSKVAAELGVGALKRAKPEFVRRHTGQVIGGVSPFDHPAPVRDLPRPLAAAVRRDLGRRRTPRGGVQQHLRRAPADDRRRRDRGRLMEIWINPACTKCRSRRASSTRPGSRTPSAATSTTLPTTDRARRRARPDGPRAVGHRAAQGDARRPASTSPRTPLTATTGWPRWSPTRAPSSGRSSPLDDGTTVIARDEETLGDVVDAQAPGRTGHCGRGWRANWRRWAEVRLPAAVSPGAGETAPRPRVAAMARVVVIGGGYGGLASAARLAKLGHEVTLLEGGRPARRRSRVRRAGRLPLGLRPDAARCCPR